MQVADRWHMCGRYIAGPWFDEICPTPPHPPQLMMISPPPPPHDEGRM